MTDSTDTSGDVEQISDVSDSVPAAPEVSDAAADPTDAIRSEIHREYATRLAQAELRIQAAVAGIQFPDGFVDLLDSSKFVGEDGEPCTDAIYLALKPFASMREPEFPQLQGMGYHRGTTNFELPVSLDARNR